MDKAKNDLQTNLLLSLITIVCLMAAGMFTYVIGQNKSDIKVMQGINQIKLDVKDLHYMNNDIYISKIIPAFDLSKKNKCDIQLLKNAIHSIDSNQKVTNYNVIRIYDWVRKNKELSFVD